MRVPYITRVTGLLSGTQMDKCRPLEHHEMRDIFRDRWLGANPDLTESDVLALQARGLQVRQGWVERFRQPSVMEQWNFAKKVA